MAKIMKLAFSGLLLLSLFIACAPEEAETPAQKAPVETPPPVKATPLQDTRLLTGELEEGRRFYINQGCSNCHGGLGEGGSGDTLRGTKRTVEEFQDKLRIPSGMMPTFDQTEITDEQIKVLYNYVKSLENIKP